MLLHLPIVILATLSPVAVSDTVPKFDILRADRPPKSTAAPTMRIPRFGN
jgi:hypothetical protein